VLATDRDTRQNAASQVKNRTLIFGHGSAVCIVGSTFGTPIARKAQQSPEVAVDIGNMIKNHPDQVWRIEPEFRDALKAAERFVNGLGRTPDCSLSLACLRECSRRPCRDTEVRSDDRHNRSNRSRAR
jgi:hypothetical protein